MSEAVDASTFNCVGADTIPRETHLMHRRTSSLRITMPCALDEIPSLSLDGRYCLPPELRAHAYLEARKMG